MKAFEGLATSSNLALVIAFYSWSKVGRRAHGSMRYKEAVIAHREVKSQEHPG